jgi:tetratricopeptide (TPR) repeat protein
MNTNRESRQKIILLGLILIITACVFLPSLRFNFTNWDDPDLIINNDSIKKLNLHHLAQIFSQSYLGWGGYTPLVFISYAINYRFSKLDPHAYHRTNLAIHLLNIILVFFIIWRLSKSHFVTFFTTLVFAIHPMHVEAIVWIQGRKDLLFSFFYLLAILAYLRYLRSSKKTLFFTLTIVFFILSLLSKIIAVSFPLVLFLLDYVESGDYQLKELKKKLYFLLIVAIFLVISLTTTSPIQLSGVRGNQFLLSIIKFFYAPFFYIGKAFIPIALSVRYSDRLIFQIPTIMISFIFSSLFIAFASIFKKKTNNQIVLFSFSFFIITLLPCMIFNAAGTSYADRYTYLPYLAIFVLVFSKTQELCQKVLMRKLALIRAATCVFLCLSALLLYKTYHQSLIWKDSLSLWNDTIKQDPFNSIAYSNRGSYWMRKNQYTAAQEDIKKAISLSPFNSFDHINLGIILADTKNYAQAIQYFNNAFILDPLDYRVFWNRANALAALKQYRLALEDIKRAIVLKPDYSPLYYVRGVINRYLGDLTTAISDISKAIAFSENVSILYIERAKLYFQVGRFDLAARDIISFNSSKLDEEEMREAADVSLKIVSIILRPFR